VDGIILDATGFLTRSIAPSIGGRNLIERLFCRLKNWRRLATRYDRLARNYIAALALVSVVIEWI
jgi:transposase